MIISRNGKNGGDGKFDWKDALVDASIMAGSTFFLSLVGMGVSGLLVEPIKCLIGASIASGAEFFAILMMKRGLVKKG